MNTSKLLVVDDDFDICFLLSNVLNYYHIQFHTANSLKEAKSALEKHSPTHIFLDNRLPDGNGIDFIDYVSKKYPSTKIIFSTGHFEDVEDRINVNGKVSLILKPLTIEKIKDIIHTLE